MLENKKTKKKSVEREGIGDTNGNYYAWSDSYQCSKVGGRYGNRKMSKII